MWNINIVIVQDRVHVRVLRWKSEGRFPAQLADMELVYCPGESELGLISRCARAVELELEVRRREPEPELY
jgi:hypothetical protein